MNLRENDKQPFFKVPEKYFDQLPSKIMERTKVTERGIHGFHSFHFKMAFVCVLLILVTFYFVRFPIQESSSLKVDLLENISNEELFNYISQTDINTNEILEVVINEENIDDLLVTPSLEEEYMRQEDLLEDIIWNNNEEYLHLEDK